MEREANKVKSTVVAIPHEDLGQQLFAVLSAFGERKPENINEHVKRTFGEQYALDGVLALKQIGLEKFPVNATHKIMKPDVQKAVQDYLETQSPNGLLN